MASYILLFLFTILSYGSFVCAYLDLVVPDSKHGLDLELFESVLDPVVCDEQIKYMQQYEQDLLLKFLDAGIRTPRGFLAGNTLDLGNYYQCLGINQPIPNSVVEGKYCMINLPLQQNWPSLPTLPEWPDILWPEISWPELNPNNTRLRSNVAKHLREYDRLSAWTNNLLGIKNNVDRSAESPLRRQTFRLAVCIPKVCSPRTALNSFFNSTELSFIEFEETFCRLPNDKPWVTGEYVAVTIFSFIGVLVILSTAYDLRYNYFLQEDPKKINKLYISFSVYTNTRRLVTYNSVPGTIECLDGIRVLAMMWVIIGHTFATRSASGLIANNIDTVNFMLSFKSVWITSAPISVDTFFMLSGFLLVYSTVGKLSGMKLLKNLHLFYLNRILRMFPVLATMILLQISVLNRVVDGPVWSVVLEQTHRCRVYWWSTLLYVQNYVTPSCSCLGHAWYLAIDMQLHILSPLVLFWVLSKNKRHAWSALIGSMIVILAASTTYNFIMNLPPGPMVFSRPQSDGARYSNYYYVNTLTRASPFFVGLIFGYILHITRGKKVLLSTASAAILWLCAMTLFSLIVYSNYPIIQFDWNNQLADNMINSFMRPAWALALGLLIFACEHGYGGPINWFLSLRGWKLLSRLSYALYLVHYPIMFVLSSMPVTPIYFTVSFFMYEFLADFALTFLIAFLITVIIDAPFSVLVKHCLGGGIKKPSRVAETEITEDSKPDLSKIR